MIYAWKNNKKRARLYGRSCRIVCRSTRFNSVLVEFENGQRECVSFNAMQKGLPMAKAKQIESKEVDSGDLIRESKEPHILPIPIDKEYRQKAAEEFADKLQAIKDIDAEKKAAAADFKARTEKITEEMNELSQIIRSGKIHRSVPCTLTLNFSTLMATVRRDDTGEIVNERPMTPTEKNSDPTQLLPGMEGQTEYAEEPEE
jgi:hypothetical protein